MINSLASYDITIIGAGPAGSLLAYILALKGIRVLLLEKFRLPRKKVCAGGITVRAKSLLPFDFEEAVEGTIFGVRLSYGLVEKRLRIYDKPLAYMVDRAKFDHLIVQRAVDKGVQLLEGVEVTEIEALKDYVKLNTSSGTVFSPIVAAADGANSTVVLKLGLKKGFEYGLGINGEINVERSGSSKWEGVIGLVWGIKGGY